MKVSIRRILEKEKEQVIIECTEITPQIAEIRAFAMSHAEELTGIYDGEKRKRFSLHDVYYFEAVDEKVFAYTSEKVYEIRARLYEVEQTYEAMHFARCSKSVVLNLMQLECISPSMNGRFLAHMKNGEKLIISRQYAKAFKQIIMGGNSDEK